MIWRLMRTMTEDLRTREWCKRLAEYLLEQNSVVTMDIIDARQSNDYFQTIRSLGKNEL